MSIFSVAETGTKLYRSRFNLSYRKSFDARYADIIPIMSKFVLPGDVWKAGATILIRYQPTLAPPLTRAWARVRYFFVPLRLVEPNTEKIITGSDNGKVIETELPRFAGFLDRAGEVQNSNIVAKHSFWDMMGIPCIDYSNIKNEDSMPAMYWLKAYLRCFFDYYRDENLDQSNDFDVFWQSLSTYGGQLGLLSANIHKDYFTSSLPWQLKGAVPTFEISGGHVNFDEAVVNSGMTVNNWPVNIGWVANHNPQPGDLVGPYLNIQSGYEQQLKDALSRNSVEGERSFNMSDLRLMAAQTRVFERLARCGSRYTEYLKSNFMTAPSDGTLQRAQYLGGFKQPIVTTEIAQTAEDGNTPVGTLRGKGISFGGNDIKPFIAKEFGMIFGMMDIMPEIQYTQGIDRELTYKSRFNFFNPSFQHLSEQEVRNGELFISDDSSETNPDNKNDSTFGFQAIYNELRTSRDMVVGDLRDNLSYWVQALHFGSRPHLNASFISGSSYRENFNSPFTVKSADSYPMIVDCYNSLDVYRPMVKYGTPGLIDHL